MKDQRLTVEQQVWLAAWTAAITSGKYNPEQEAEACLAAFRQKFTPIVGGRKLRLLEIKHQNDESDIKDKDVEEAENGMRDISDK